MKKILLVAAIALVTLSVSAVNRPHLQRVITKEMKANFANERKAKFTTPDSENIQAKLKATNAEQKANKTATTKVSRRAGEIDVDQLIPAFSEESSQYTSILEGFIARYMYDGASFLVDGEKAYLAPFKNLGYVEGVLDTESENLLANYGAVLYKFTSDVVGHNSYYDIDLSLEPGVQDEETYLVSRSGETTFFAYYFEEENQLYVPEILALFDANSNDTEVYYDGYVIADLWLVSQDEFKPYISKGTFTGESLWGEDQNVAGDCEIFVGYEDVYYIKGANGTAFESDTWIAYEIDENDLSIATVEPWQYVTQASWYIDETMTETVDGIIITYAVDTATGKYTQYSQFKITDNADNTTTIANTNNTLYDDFGYFSDESYGSWNTIDLNITILWESAYPDDTAIKGIKNEKASTNGTYNLNGQRVSDNAKGLIIKDGKKYIAK